MLVHKFCLSIVNIKHKMTHLLCLLKTQNAPNAKVLDRTKHKDSSLRLSHPRLPPHRLETTRIALLPLKLQALLYGLLIFILSDNLCLIICFFQISQSWNAAGNSSVVDGIVFTVRLLRRSVFSIKCFFTRRHAYRVTLECQMSLL